MSSESRIAELDEEYESLACERREYEGRGFSEATREERDYLSDRMSDVIDKMTANRRIRAFHEGEGFVVTLRVMPERWQDDDPAQWNWQELLDSEAVVVVDSHPVGTMDQLRELLQSTK
jgi:hypothetical protein